MVWRPGAANSELRIVDLPTGLKIRGLTWNLRIRNLFTLDFSPFRHRVLCTLLQRHDVLNLQSPDKQRVGN